MLLVGFSRIKAWRRCRRLYNYRYRQFLVRRRPRVQLIRGTILHEMLKAMAKGNSVEDALKKYEKEFGKLFAEEREEYGDLIGDCRKIFDNYVARWRDDGLKVVACEHEIRVELIPGEVTFKGTIDRVLLEKMAKGRSRRWILDSKSHKNIPGEEARFFDLQLGVFYFWAWNETHPKQLADGIIWDYLRTKLPVDPEVLKSGQLSQRANIDTTYAHAAGIVLAHCQKTGQSPKLYQDWLDGLKGREEKFLKRVFLPSPPKVMIRTIVDELRVTSRDILDRPDSDERTMVSGSMGCNTCEFRDLCMAELRGQDAEFIRKAEFRVDAEAMAEDFAEED